jgi:ABC-type bacteriocin/lantibiotic exporter with double-glycine peptidase domain
MIHFAQFTHFSTGAVLVDGVDVREYDCKWLRQQIGTLVCSAVILSIMSSISFTHAYTLTTLSHTHRHCDAESSLVRNHDRGKHQIREPIGH